MRDMLYEKKEFRQVCKVNTADNIADWGTKGLARVKHLQMMEMGNMMTLTDFLDWKPMRATKDLGYTLLERGPTQDHPMQRR